MSVNKFDEALRKRLEGFEAAPAEDVWAGIESALDRKARWRLIRRTAGIAAAAAACLVAGVLVFDNGGETAAVSIQDGSVAVAPVATAPATPVAEATAATEEPVTASLPAKAVAAPKVGSVAPIGEQLRSIAETYAENIVGTQDAALSDEAAAAQPPAETIPVTEDNGAAAVASIDWNAIIAEEEESSSSLFGTPLLAISSNITSNSASGGFISDFGPGRAPSREGSKAVSGLPVPIDEPSYYMPLSFGVQMKLPVSHRISLGIGVDYTYIVTRFTSLVNGVKYDDTYSQLHYVGIPLGLYANLLQGRATDFYLSLGGSLEKCVGSRYVYGSNAVKSEVPGLQFSAMAGLGVEYRVTPSIGLYLDPSLVYYFENPANPQPLSIRTAEPLQIRFEAGLRFRLRPQGHRRPGGRF